MAAARAIAAARRRRRRRCSRCRSCTPTGGRTQPRGRSRRSGRRLGRGRRAPPRRRLRRPRRCDDPDGPAPDPGQFYMLAAAERWGGGEDERPFLPRAFSVLRRRGRRAAWSSCSRPSGRARRGSASCAPGDGLWIAGPFGNGFAPPARQAPPARCSSAAGSERRRWRSGRTRSARVRARAARLPRRARTPRARRCCADARVATDDGSRRPQGPRDRPAARRARAATPRAEVYACGPPAMLEAVRAICAEPGVPAQLALESGDGLRLRRLLRLRRADEATATCACASTAPSSTREPIVERYDA